MKTGPQVEVKDPDQDYDRNRSIGVVLNVDPFSICLHLNVHDFKMNDS